MLHDEAIACESSDEEVEDQVDISTQAGIAAEVQPAAEHQEHDVEEEEGDSEEEDEDDSEEDAEDELNEVAAATEHAEDDDTPNWLMEACDEVGVEKPSGHTTPPLEPEKKPMSLRERLAQVKATKGVVEVKKNAARSIEFITATDEVLYLREELNTLRRESRLQAQYIETLKQKNEVLEQRLALREEFDTM